MALVAARSFLDSSSVYKALAASEKSERVGIGSQIDLPLVRINEIGALIGKKIARGDLGVIYEVQGIDSKRVFKFIPVEKFQSGDEIRAAKIAGEIGVGPTIHASFVVQQNRQKFVAIEMDKLGRSLGGWMQALAIEKNLEKAAALNLPTLEEEEALRDELMKKAAEDAGSSASFIAVEMPKKKRIGMEEAVEILYGTQESFYFELFSAIKALAEKNVAYLDTNCGNLIPSLDKRLHLIDFDCASITKRVSRAAFKVLHAIYSGSLFKEFCRLPNLSDPSKELIAWFKVQEEAEVLHQIQQTSPDSKEAV